MVTHGSAGFQTQGKTLTVTNTPGAIINWQSFSIGQGETTRFQQQSAASTVLNRVRGQDPSVILGTLSSNGRVFLINANGIVFGAGSRIDTQGLVASTLNISDADFKKGLLKLAREGQAGSIQVDGYVNGGTGDIYIVAPNIGVGREGVVKSEGGQVVLAAGEKIEIGQRNLNDIKFEVQAPAHEARILGKLSGGAVGVFAGTLKHSGDIRAQSASGEGGRIVLKAQADLTLGAGSQTVADGKVGGTIDIRSEAGSIFADRGAQVSASAVPAPAVTPAASAVTGAGGTVGVIAPQGQLAVEAQASIKAIGNSGGQVVLEARQGRTTLRGQVDVRGSAASPSGERIPAADSRGGSVQVLGQEVILDGSASIDASGDSGGGTVLIGGDFQGRNPAVHNARRSYLGDAVTVRADALLNGSGGKVIVWADEATHFRASISARGGQGGGDGGLVEVSGKGALLFRGRANTEAPLGRRGLLLLDPTDIDIGNGSASGGGGADDGIWTFLESPGSNNIGALYIQNTLLPASDVTLQATNSITMSSGTISYAGPARTLTLQAGGTIGISGTINMVGSFVASAGDAASGSPSAAAGLVITGGISANNVTLRNSGTGGVAVQGGASVTGTSTVTYQADSMSLAGTTSAGGGVLTLRTFSGGAAIFVGEATGTGLNIPNSALQTLTAATVVVGDSGQSGNVVVKGAQFTAAGPYAGVAGINALAIHQAPVGPGSVSIDYFSTTSGDGQIGGSNHELRGIELGNAGRALTIVAGSGGILVPRGPTALNAHIGTQNGTVTLDTTGPIGAGTWQSFPSQNVINTANYLSFSGAEAPASIVIGQNQAPSDVWISGGGNLNVGRVTIAGISGSDQNATSGLVASAVGAINFGDNVDVGSGRLWALADANRTGAAVNAVNLSAGKTLTTASTAHVTDAAGTASGIVPVELVGASLNIAGDVNVGVDADVYVAPRGANGAYLAEIYVGNQTGGLLPNGSTLPTFRLSQSTIDRIHLVRGGASSTGGVLRVGSATPAVTFSSGPITFGTGANAVTLLATSSGNFATTGTIDRDTASGSDNALTLTANGVTFNALGAIGQASGAAGLVLSTPSLRIVNSGGNAVTVTEVSAGTTNVRRVTPGGSGSISLTKAAGTLAFRPFFDAAVDRTLTNGSISISANDVLVEDATVFAGGTLNLGAAGLVTVRAVNLSSAAPTSAASFIHSAGAQTISANGVVVQGGTGNNNRSALIRADGGQTITVGSGGITIQAGGSFSDGWAGIVQGGTGADQTITVNGGGGISIAGASGVNNFAAIENLGLAQSISLTAGGTISIQGGNAASGSYAEISNNGAAATTQTIAFGGAGAILATGGNGGNENSAGIFAARGNQTINGNPDITLNGGNGGGAAPPLDNSAYIFVEGGTGTQTVNAGTVQLTGQGGAGGSFAVAVIGTGATGTVQLVNTTGNLVLGAGPGTDAAALVGAFESNGNATINVGGSLELTGGAGSAALYGAHAVVGAVNGASTLTLNVQGNVTLNKGAVGDAIIGSTSLGAGAVTVNAGLGGSGTIALNDGKVLTAGNVVLQANAANGQITQTPGGIVSTASLATNSSIGTTLPGNNVVSTFSASNAGAGDISIRTTGSLVLGPITQSGGNLSLTTAGAITQSAPLAVSGGVTLDTSANGGLGSVSITAVNPGGALELAAGSQVAGDLTINAGSRAVTVGATVDVGGSATVATTGAVSGNANLRAQGTNNIALGGCTPTVAVICASGGGADFTLSQSAIDAAAGSFSVQLNVGQQYTGNAAILSSAILLTDGANSIGGPLLMRTGNPNLVAAGGGQYNLIQSGALNFGGRNLTVNGAGASDVLLDNAGNSGLASLALANTRNNTLVLGGAGGTLLNASTVTGSLGYTTLGTLNLTVGGTVAAGGAVTLATPAGRALAVNAAVSAAAGDITYVADSLALVGATTATAGDIRILPATASRTIHIGTETVGQLSMSLAELATLQVADPARALRFGDGSSAGVNIISGSPTSAVLNAKNLVFTNAATQVNSSLNLSGAGGGQNANVSFVGSGPMTIGGDINSGSGIIDLGAAAVSFSGISRSLTSSNAGTGLLSTGAWTLSGGGGGPAAVVDARASLNTVTLSAGTNYTLQFLRPSTVNTLNWNAGQVAGAGGVNGESLTIGTTLNWAGGGAFNLPVLNIAGGAVANVSGSVGGDNGMTVNNAGTWNHNAAAFAMGDGTTIFNNQAGGTLNLIGAASISSVDQFVNAGQIVKSGAGIAVLSAGDAGGTFTGAGSVAAQAGTLQLGGSPAAFGGTHSGSYAASAGATIEFTGSATRTFDAGSSFSGPGAIVVSAGNNTFAGGWTGADISVGAGTTATFSGPGLTVANVTVAGTATFSNSSANAFGTLAVSAGTTTIDAASTVGTLTQSGGTVTGSANLALSGAGTWSAGTMSGTGTTQILNGATLGISGATTLSRPLDSAGAVNLTGTILLNRTWTNAAAGVVTQSGAGQVNFSGNGVVNNAGTWNLAGTSANPLAQNAGLGNVFNNTGTLNKSTATVATISNLSGGFSNAGRVEFAPGGGTLTIGS
ncbi:MAG: filamentous hemagglutinin N-terminal domain-containing protein, partial [Burkholderiales bacterium]|nr:filamentous hemagglutinin N-terminal domain-containing protein [Burkholderiales bacterium]